MEDEGGAAGGNGAAGEGGQGAGKAVSSRNKRAKKGAQEINQANVVATLKRYGGRLASKVRKRRGNGTEDGVGMWCSLLLLMVGLMGARVD